MRTVRNLQDVVDWGLCVGCGACYSNCDSGNVMLVNIETVGIRPAFKEPCAGCSRCLSICPGYTLDATLASNGVAQSSQADREFGTALEIWEGYAADPEIRYKGSSGGLLTVLALYCLERERMRFVLHSGMDEDAPWTNRTVQSRTRAELISRTGSRYAPASPCDGLREIESADGPCVFIGKPCDAAAAMMVRRECPALDRNLGLVLTFFCAGTPSSKGTKDLIATLGLDPREVTSVSYRGEGWPGEFRAIANDNGTKRTLSYAESWGFLTKYRPLRCNICPDGLGRLADLACGDSWANFSGDNKDAGRSLVLVRTDRGRRILHGAMAAGYVTLSRVGPELVLRAQENLLQRRREIFGRVLGMKLLLIPVPKFSGFSLYESWSRLPLILKLRTVLGTVRRMIKRGSWRQSQRVSYQTSTQDQNCRSIASDVK